MERKIAATAIGQIAVARHKKVPITARGNNQSIPLIAKSIVAVPKIIIGIYSGITVIGNKKPPLPSDTVNDAQTEPAKLK